MNPTHIRLLYLRELRSALRERAIVVNGILMPVFLYLVNSLASMQIFMPMIPACPVTLHKR